MHDLHNNIRQVRCLTPVAIGTTGTGKTGAVIDRAGWGGVEFIINVGAITATNATFTVVVKEGAATGSLTSVADTDLLGTETAASVVAGTPRTSGVNKNCTRRIGYRGSKRYVNCSIINTVTAAALVDITAVLHSPHLMPTTNP